MGRPTNAMIEERKRLEDQAVRRFVLDDLDSWMMGRINERWPGISEATWRGKFAQFSAANYCLLITNEDAVGMFYYETDLMTGKTVIRERFVWSRSARKTTVGDWVVPHESRYPVLALYRYALEWAKSTGAYQFLEKGRCSDMTPSSLREALGGEYTVYSNAA